MSRDYHSHLQHGQLFRKTDVSSAAEHPRKTILSGHNGATRVSPFESVIRRNAWQNALCCLDWACPAQAGDAAALHIFNCDATLVFVQGSRDMSAALTVCDSASNALAERSDMLASVAKDLESGVMNICIARGCIRSLQNALVTLVKHSSLLLKDVMLRLDVWNDTTVPHIAATMRQKVWLSSMMRSSAYVPDDCTYHPFANVQRLVLCCESTC